ncbi:unnamed protein product [Polarella glacialis]|uniref:PDZ domain-containing protein n=1 Tax=Polarella glacialis TaxID=89957 RepID=A0A813GRY8_POLGL|nr:unnamed protein product [Polarella glacialis]
MFACCTGDEKVGQQGVPSPAAELVDLKSEFAPAPAVESLPRPAAAGATLVIELDRSGTVKDLGLSLDSTDEDLCIIKDISQEGIVMKYNMTCPAGKAIKIYDRIVSLNGKRGSLTEFTKVLADSKDQNTLIIEVVQPTETSVLFKQPGDFGITLNYKRASVGLRVMEIHDGLLSEWNKAHPDTPIKSGDLIVAVNGVTNQALSLLQQIKEANGPVLTVMRYVP